MAPAVYSIVIIGVPRSSTRALCVFTKIVSGWARVIASCMRGRRAAISSFEICGPRPRIERLVPAHLGIAQREVGEPVDVVRLVRIAHQIVQECAQPRVARLRVGRQPDQLAHDLNAFPLSEQSRARRAPANRPYIGHGSRKHKIFAGQGDAHVRAILDPPSGFALSLRLREDAVAFHAGEAERRCGIWNSRRSPWVRAALLLAACAILAGCGLGGEARYPTSRQPGQGKPVYDEQQSVFGPGGLTLGGTEKPGEGESGGGGAGIGVNSFLWRASLDTVSFMPLVSADPFGGVIITDWYSPPQSPDERFKVNVYILGRALRADGIRASVFRQQHERLRRLGRRPGRSQHRDGSGERDPDARPPDAHRAARRITDRPSSAPVCPGGLRPTGPAGQEPSDVAVQFQGNGSHVAGPLGRAPLLRRAGGCPPARSTMFWRCFHIPPAASIWAMCATTPSATSLRATSGPRASTSCIRWAGTPSACRPRMPPWKRRSIRRNGPTTTSRPCATS